MTLGPALISVRWHRAWQALSETCLLVVGGCYFVDAYHGAARSTYQH